MKTLFRKLALMACLAGFSFAMPATALAELVQPAETPASLAPIQPQGLQACPQPGDKGFHLAQTIQTECCKDRKGVCGCRAGKIVCCDGKPSTVTGCTCHGDDGFLE